MFSLSHNTPDLEQSVRRLSTFTNHSLGCLSVPLPGQNPFFSCSIAIFDKNSCVPFSTLETGAGPTQVGRWHAYDKRRTHDVCDEVGEHASNGQVVDWDKVWTAAGSERYVPQELKNVCGIRTLIYFSDNSSWELATALRRHLPQASQLGVIAAATPFITGHPFTLLRDGKLQTSGAVGIALKTTPVENVMTFEGAVKLTEPIFIKRSEGNLVHELKNGFPARILLKAVQDHGLSGGSAKEVDYYIGLNDSKDHSSDKVPARLLKIIAGSPSRGSIAVEEVPAPPPGSRIEFFYRHRASPVCLPTDMFDNKCRQSGPVIGALIDTPENAQASMGLATAEYSEAGPLRTYKSSFVISTEHGFIHNPGPSSELWKCTVPGAFGGFRFS